MGDAPVPAKGTAHVLILHIQAPPSSALTSLIELVHRNPSY